MSTITFKNVKKKYETAQEFTIKDFSLEIEDGEFVALVGPSGCGKTTTLRMLAGLEEITEGTIEIDETVVNNVLPRNRNIAMVFQNYALYPHKTVYKNISFGLKMNKVPKDIIKEKVEHASEILGITDQLQKKPKNLSGGQRQRVALARAIVKDSGVFLMDEPLSNLDAKLRASTRTEITKLHQSLGSTIVYVTHDQVEAMTMATKIVVMDKGEILQVGSPEELYTNPQNLTVATFIGTPQMNILDAKYMDEVLILSNDFTIKLNDEQIEKMKQFDGLNLKVGIRPECFSTSRTNIKNHQEHKHELKANVIELLGKNSLVYSEIGNSEVIIDSDKIFSVGELYEVVVLPETIYIFNFDSGERII